MTAVFGEFVEPEPDPRQHVVLPVDQAALAAAVADLTWLAEEGALAGVAAIINERRRAIEVHRYELLHDDGHHTGALVSMAMFHATRLGDLRKIGIADPARSDEDHVRTAAALMAAELDRLGRLPQG